MDGIRNKLWKRGANTNNTNIQDLCDTLQKYVENTVPNVTSQEMNIKALSCFPQIQKLHSLKPDMSQYIEPDNDFKYWDPTVPNQKQNQITTKQNFGHTFYCDEFDRRVMTKDGFFCIILVIYFILILFLLRLLYFFYIFFSI